VRISRLVLIIVESIDEGLKVHEFNHIVVFNLFGEDRVDILRVIGLIEDGIYMF
jgi:hypothetical protein